MTGLALRLVLQVSVLGGDPTSYDEAFKAADTSGKPLVVLIGTDWCPGCKLMKNNTLANLVRRGKMKEVQYSTVNADSQPALARKLMRGTSIPQLIVYTKTPSGWKKEHTVGPKSEAEVSAMIDRAAKLAATEKPAATESEVN